MTEQRVDDITHTWILRRGSQTNRSRFHLVAEVEAEFVEPTRDEVRDALLQILDESLGPDEIAGWAEAGNLDLERSELPTGVSLTLGDAAELEHLRRWKAEALPLLETIDRCHALLPPGYQAELGHSKADAVFRYLHATAD